MRLKFVLIFTVLAAAACFGQNDLRLTAGGKTYSIPAYDRQGTTYFSVKHFADAIKVKYYYNTQAQKFELKFPSYNFKVTAKNPYIVLVPAQGGDPLVYQLPTSSYLINGNVYIPVNYTIPLIEKASGLQITIKARGDIAVKGNIKNVEPPAPPAEVVEKEEAAVKGAFNLTGIVIEEKANGTLVKIKSNKRIKTYTSDYSNGILTIILRNASVDAGKLNKTFGKGLVKEIKAKNIKGDAEIQFILSREYTTSEVIDSPGSYDILITIHNKIFAHNEADGKKEKWNFDVIVIDAGHGGKDAGAIGPNGLKEKEVNLGVALKLGKLIEANMKGVKVVYTRDDDRFVELYRRGKIANEKQGKLFISIHCNSTPQKPSDATGFEVYLLRPGRTKEAISIAERENSVIKYEENPGRYQKLTDENFILVSMAHSSYMKYSEKFAELLNRQFSSDLSLPSRGVKQAGLYVLVGASMPGVLIETGFISNSREEKYLKSQRGQQDYAESIFQSVKKFKDYYDQALSNN